MKNMCVASASGSCIVAVISRKETIHSKEMGMNIIDMKL